MEPELEKPPKPGWQLLTEGCLLLILGAVVVAAACAGVFRLLEELKSGL